jgi:hypothetical protein
MDLNRFSIPKRLSPSQLAEILNKFGLSYIEFYEMVAGRNFDFDLCDYICRLLGYKKWYPKHYPRGMGGSNKKPKRKRTKITEILTKDRD